MPAGVSRNDMNKGLKWGLDIGVDVSTARYRRCPGEQQQDEVKLERSWRLKFTDQDEILRYTER